MLRILKFIALILLSLFAIEAPAALKMQMQPYHWGQGARQFTAAAQDSLGVMWFGTDCGLYSYDGYSFDAIEASVQPCFIHSVQSIGANKLCFTGQNGAHIYDVEHRSIVSTALDSLPECEMRSFAKVGNKLWLGSEKLGLFSYDIVTNKVSRTAASKLFDIYSIVSDYAGNLYIGTLHGLWRYNVGTNKLNLIDKSVSIYSLLWDRVDKKLWVGAARGLYEYTPGASSLKSLLNNDTFFKSIVRADGTLYLGTDNGLIAYNIASKATNIYVHDLRDAYSLSNNVVWNVFVDRESNIWISTGYGVTLLSNSMYYDFTPLTTLVCHSNITNPQSGTFSAVLRDTKGRLWLGGNNGIILSQGDDIKWYRNEYVDRHIPHNNVRRIYEDLDHNVWIATDGGLLRYDASSDHMIAYDITNSSGSNHAKWIYDICDDGKGHLWIGTYSTGVFVADKNQLLKTGNTQLRVPQLNNIVSNSNISSAFQIKADKVGNIWITHREGLSMYNPTEGTIKSVKLKGKDGNICNFYLSYIALDDDGYLWYAADGTLGRLDIASGISSLVDVPNDSHQSILAMTYRNGKLWIARSKGVSVYDPSTSSLKELCLPDCDYASIFYDDNVGEFVVGAHDAIVTFTPAIYAANVQLSPVSLVGISCNFKDININDYRSSYANATLKRISFPAGSNYITFEISNFDYDAMNQYHLEYRLDKNGHPGQWIALDAGDNKISFIELGRGKYILQLRSSITPDQISSYEFEILPPWYASNWAIAVYVLLVVIAIALLFKYIDARTQKRRESFEKQQALELSRMKIDFFTNISHDLKTPLSLIIAPLAQLMHENNDATLSPRLEGIYRNAMRLSGLIQRVLDFKIVSSRSDNTLMRSQVEINKVIESIVSSFAQSASLRGIKLSVTQSAPETWMNLDLFKIESVLYNILSNAIKFVDDNTGEIEVSVVRDDKNSQVIISVHDNGIGISKADLRLVWLKLYRGETNGRNPQGSGIGLYLVKKFVSLHDGEVDIDSEPQHGTTVTVKLPMTAENMIETAMPIQSDEIQRTSVSVDKHVMLIIDDNEELRNFMHSTFMLNYDCHMAKDGIDGLQVAEKVHPDIIIVDEMMPNMSGLEFCRRIREISYLASTPIIMLTAKDDSETEINSIKAGVDAFMNKPFDLARLNLRIEQLLESRKIVAQDMRRRTKIEEVSEVKEDLESGDEYLMRTVLNCIEEHIADPDFNVTRLSECTGIGQRKLLRLIKSTTGATPVNFIRQLRLRKAAVLLRQKRFTISEIMYMVGMSHASYFTRSFTEEFGISPKEYAETHHE